MSKGGAVWGVVGAGVGLGVGVGVGIPTGSGDGGLVGAGVTSTPWAS